MDRTPKGGHKGNPISQKRKDREEAPQKHISNTLYMQTVNHVFILVRN